MQMFYDKLAVMMAQLWKCPDRHMKMGELDGT